MAIIQGTLGNDNLFAESTGDELQGLAGNDTLDALPGQGNNTLIGGAGNDELFANINDRLFGEAGNDTLEARAGTGNNSLDGGAGNDFLYGFNNDTLIGGTGSDSLFGGVGGSVLTGGRGGDLFAIVAEAPTTVSTITDFTQGLDVIGIDGFTPDLNFADLVFEQQANNTLIKTTTGATLVTLQNFSGQLAQTDFVFDLKTLPVLPENSPGDIIEYYRFRNTAFSTGTYLFVAKEERDAILANPDFNQTFVLEGNGNIAFKASTQPGQGFEPFYRLRSLDVPGTYLFVGPQEYDAIFAPTSDQKDKWVKEGFDTNNNDIPEFYLYGVNQRMGIPFNRFQNKDNNTFLFAGPQETQAILADPNFSGAFTDQGGAFETLI